VRTIRYPSISRETCPFKETALERRMAVPFLLVSLMESAT